MTAVLGESEVVLEIPTTRMALSAAEFAELIGLPYKSVLELMAAGDIEWVPAGKHKIIPAWAARKFLRVPPPS